jgi:hypothetical protein
MAVETLPFNYSPAQFLKQFNDLIYTGKDWTFRATFTKSGKKTINFFYSRKMDKWTESGTGDNKTRKKVPLPSKSILFIIKLIMFSKKQGYNITATLMGDYKED